MIESLDFIRGRNIALRPVLEGDLNQTYLSWLNDPLINEWSERRCFPTSQQEMRAFFESDSRSRLLLAITAKTKHIGNILLSDMDFFHRRAELSILVGDRDQWGAGVGAEAIYLLTRHAFTVLELNRLYAGTISPAVVMIFRKLHWQHEGTRKEDIFRNGNFVDSHEFAILASAFCKESGYEHDAEMVE